jgi:ABC-type dipeptide/oligopeptide/nickel transport system permease component
VLPFVVRRLALIVPVVLGAMTLVFLLVHLIPGDAAVFIAGERASQDAVERIRQKMGLDQPIGVQYWRYLTRLVLHGDFGDSVVTGTPVARELRRAFPNTLVLTAIAVVWSVTLGIVLGVGAAMFRGSILDRGIMSLSVFGVSFPGFFISLAILYVLAFKLELFPLGGRGPSLLTPEGLRYLVLPAVAAGFDMLAQVARMTRTSILETLGTDYVRTARAKGVPRRRVVFLHALRPALVPVITLVGIAFARLLSGAVVVETVFAWPGIGRLVVASILVKDLPMIQGVLLLKALITVGMNLVVDLTYGIIDPRMRYA